MRTEKSSSKQSKQDEKTDSGDEEIFYDLYSNTNYLKLFTEFQDILRQQIADCFDIKINDTGLKFEHFIQLLNQYNGSMNEILENFQLKFQPNILVINNYNVSHQQHPSKQNEPSPSIVEDEDAKNLFGDDELIDSVEKPLNDDCDSVPIKPSYITNVETYIYSNELVIDY